MLIALVNFSNIVLDDLSPNWYQGIIYINNEFIVTLPFVHSRTKFGKF